MASGDPYSGPLLIPMRTIPPWDATGPFSEDEILFCCGIDLFCAALEDTQSIVIPFTFTFRIENVTPPGAGGFNDGDEVEAFTLDESQTGLTSGLAYCTERQIASSRYPSGFSSPVTIGAKRYMIYIGYGSSPADPDKPFFCFIDAQGALCGAAVSASAAAAPWLDFGIPGQFIIWFSADEFNSGVLYNTAVGNVTLLNFIPCGTTASTRDIWIEAGSP